MQALLAAEADVNAKQGANSFDQVTVLIPPQNGGPKWVTPSDKVTALMLASQNGHLEVIQALLAAKADVNARQRDGSAALMLALQNNHPEVAKLLTSAIAAGPAGK
jgi:serine/threonine-protein phosphatase 6 regulatory ankyrin repeat subunit B